MSEFVPDELAGQVRQKSRGLMDYAFYLIVAEALQQRCDRIQTLEKELFDANWAKTWAEDGNEMLQRRLATAEEALKDQKTQTAAFEELANSRRSVSR